MNERKLKMKYKGSNDYISFVLSQYPSMENISLPHNDEISKYRFLQEVYSILPFTSDYRYRWIPLIFDTVEQILKYIINPKQTCDTDFASLYKSVQNQCKTLSKKFAKQESITYKPISTILIKTTIICENVYQSQMNKSNIITCQTASFNIDHVLWLIESKFNDRGIAYLEKNKEYDFYGNTRYLITELLESYYGWRSAVFEKNIQQAKTKMEKQVYMFYGEVLILMANEYNKQILKELPYNEW